MMKTAITRRRALTMTGAAVAGAGTLAVTASGNARANVDLSIPPTTVEGEDTSVANVSVSVTGSYQFATNKATGYRVQLLAASAPDLNDWQLIDEIQDSALAASTGGQYELAGSLLDHDNLDANGFSVDAGKSISKHVPVKVVLDVLNGEQIITSDSAEAVAQVDVTSTKVAVSSAISGSGDVTVEV